MRVKIVRKHAPVCQSVSAESERVERAELLSITILFWVFFFTQRARLTSRTIKRSNPPRLKAFLILVTG